MFDSLASARLSDTHKQSLFKLAVVLMKADNHIHHKEVSLLDELQRLSGIDHESLEMVHYLSVQQAIANLCTLDDTTLANVLDVLDSMVSVDDDIDVRERILSTAIRLSLQPQTREWCKIVTAHNFHETCSSEQAIYLETEPCDEAHAVLSNRYDKLLISNTLGSIGLHLFYLPDVINKLSAQWQDISHSTTSKNFSLLARSMKFLAPTGDRTKLDNLHNILSKLDTPTFYKVVASRYGLNAMGYRSLLMLKINDDYLLDDEGEIVRSADFLCINIEKQTRQRLFTFIEQVTSHTTQQLSYDGYYRLLYDFLSSESKIISSITIDLKRDFVLNDLDELRLRFESAPQAKTLYLLLLHYGRRGVTQECFDEALEFLNRLLQQPSASRPAGIDELKRTLIEQQSEWADLIYNTATIYEALSTKDASKESFIEYVANIIKHRSSLKSYINNGFNEVYDLARKEQYCIQRNTIGKSYYLDVNPLLFKVQLADGCVKLHEWSVFKLLR